MSSSGETDESHHDPQVVDGRDEEDGQHTARAKKEHGFARAIMIPAFCEQERREPAAG